MIHFTKSASPATESAISRFESAIGRTLPSEYREFLKQTNGGVPTPCHFNDPMSGEDFVNRVLLFYPLAAGLNQDLERQFAISRGFLSDGVLPIGEDIGAEPICLCLNNDADFGCVFGVDGFVEDTGEPIAMRRLASSFGEFLKSLFQTEEDRLAAAERAQDWVMSFAETGKPEDLAGFLAQNHSLNVSNVQGLTLMQCAARVGNLELVKVLFERGASSSCAIHQALLHHHWELARYLARAGADLNERNEHGEQPLELIYGIFGAARLELEAYLESHGARQVRTA